MKSTRKHELQTNELAEAIWGFVEAARPHARLIAYAAAAVLLLVFVFLILPAVRGRAPEGLSAYAFHEAQQGDAQSLRDLLKDYPRAPEVPAARLLLANRLVSEVVRGIGDARGSEGKAAGLLAEAKELYEQAGQSLEALDPLAQVDLALLIVQAGDVEKGVAALQEVARKWPQSIAADKAKAHVEELAGYKPMTFSNEPMEEQEKPETKTGAAPEGAAKESPPPKVEKAAPGSPKPPPEKPLEAPKAPPEKPLEAPKAPAGGQTPAPATPKG
jgi:tetratricopeptide (TPR) repeat protein